MRLTSAIPTITSSILKARFALHQALKPNGRLIVVDFDRVPGKSRDWVLSHVRAGKQEFRTEIEQAGFHYVDEPKVDGITENFIMRFKK